MECLYRKQNLPFWYLFTALGKIPKVEQAAKQALKDLETVLKTKRDFVAEPELDRVYAYKILKSIKSTGIWEISSWGKVNPGLSLLLVHGDFVQIFSGL